MIRLWWSAARPPAQPPAPAGPLPLLCRLFGHSWQHWPDPTGIPLDAQPFGGRLGQSPRSGQRDSGPGTSQPEVLKDGDR